MKKSKSEGKTSYLTCLINVLLIELKRPAQVDKKTEHKVLFLCAAGIALMIINIKERRNITTFKKNSKTYLIDVLFLYFVNFCDG